MLLDSPTLSRPIELRFEPALAALGLRWLCREVVVQGRIDVDEDMATYSVQVLKIQLLESPGLAVGEDGVVPPGLPAPGTPPPTGTRQGR